MIRSFAHRTLAVCGLALLLALSAFVQRAAAQTRVGVFDSRAVALARFHCQDFENPAKQLHAKLEQAQQQGDEKEITRLKRLGPLHQAHLHDLVFGSGSVNKYFKELKVRLSVIAKEENLVMIVSKWETAYLTADVVLVDITEKLVDFYHPDENIRRMMEGVKNSEPVEDALFLED
jgi:hypothetical protein